MSKKSITLQDIEKRLGYTFKDIDLLEKAVNPQKYPIEHQFLEHLGDVYLEVVLREWGQKRLKPDKEKYFAFVAKAKSNVILALVAENIGIIEYSNRGYSVLAEVDEELVKEHANIMEAIFCAIKRDGGIRAVQKTVEQIIPLEKILSVNIAPLNGNTVKRDPPKALADWLKQHNKKSITPVYNTQQMGSMWLCTLTVGSKTLKATGDMKYTAENFAAMWMLNILEQKRLRKVLFEAN